MRFKIVIFRITVITLIVIMSIINGGAVILKCSDCHSDAVTPVKASNTLVMNETTCFKCHNPNYPPKYDELKGKIHPVHTGGIKGLNIDYLTRHPSTSLSCDSCHKNKVDCQSCHKVGIPHVRNNDRCSECHGFMDSLFKHKKIDLKVHDIFGESSCSMCHDDAIKSLKVQNGLIVPYEDSYILCDQCHSNIFKLWIEGNHWVNATNAYIYTEPIITDPDNPRGRIIEASKTINVSWARDNRCTGCHNVHNPTKLFMQPKINEEKNEAKLSFLPILLAFLLITTIIILGYKIKNVNKK